MLRLCVPLLIQYSNFQVFDMEMESASDLGEQQVQGQPCEDGGRRPVEPALHALGLLQFGPQIACKDGDAAEDKDGSQDEEQAQPENLPNERAMAWPGELRQKGEEKDGHLGIGDVHDNAAPV